MRIKLLLIAGALVGLMSCNSNQIYFGMYSKYELRDGEVNHYPISEEKVAEYEACCYMDGLNIYLNRALTYSKESYRVFIGAGETLHSSEYPDRQRLDKMYEVTDTKEFTGKKVVYDVYRVSRDGHQLVRVGFDEPKSGLFLLVDHVFSDAGKADAFYENVESRFEEHITVK
ncbi:MAG: hypothetical protein MK081_14365 [Flavobacteriales bacterium]|nr:hypothetical protein [Flavobacteriales bacterium]